jgi:hypothetical protein
VSTAGCESPNWSAKLAVCCDCTRIASESLQRRHVRLDGPVILSLRGGEGSSQRLHAEDEVHDRWCDAHLGLPRDGDRVRWRRGHLSPARGMTPAGRTRD